MTSFLPEPPDRPPPEPPDRPPPEPPDRDVLIVPYSLLVPDPAQAKRHAGTDQHARLSESIGLHGILQALTGRSRGDGKYDVTGGTGRALVAIERKIQRVPLLVLGAADAHAPVYTVVENLLRTDLTPFQLLEGVEAVRASEPDWPNKEIARQTGLSEGTVSQVFTVAGCPTARAAVAGGLSLNNGYTVAQAPAGMKGEVLTRLKAGEGSHAVAAAVRAARKPRAAKTVKASRTVLPLSTGIKVQISGPELDLVGLIDALSTSLDAAKRAHKDHLDIKTFAKVTADKARAGA